MRKNPIGPDFESAAGREPYDRVRDLSCLIPFWPEDLLDTSLSFQARLVARLEVLLRRERMRGIAGDWAYDLARHRQLVAAYRAERVSYLRALAKAQQSAQAKFSTGACQIPCSSPGATAQPHSLERP
jgi:hypothetical protein